MRVLDTGRFGDAQSDRWGYNQSSVLNFTGRHVLPIWRILKADNKFQQYSFEHIAFHVLGVRCVALRFPTKWLYLDAALLAGRRAGLTASSATGTPAKIPQKSLEC